MSNIKHLTWIPEALFINYSLHWHTLFVSLFDQRVSKQIKHLAVRYYEKNSYLHNESLLQGQIYIGASGSMAPGPEVPGGPLRVQ